MSHAEGTSTHVVGCCAYLVSLSWWNLQRGVAHRESTHEMPTTLMPFCVHTRAQREHKGINNVLQKSIQCPLFCKKHSLGVISTYFNTFKVTLRCCFFVFVSVLFCFVLFCFVLTCYGTVISPDGQLDWILHHPRGKCLAVSLRQFSERFD
jgi:hypothetical protein